MVSHSQLGHFFTACELRDFTEDMFGANTLSFYMVIYSANYCSHSYHRHVYQVKPSHSHLEMREGLI